jgi:excisionase family DNA binding protein
MQETYLKNKREAARYLGISVGTLERMIASGRGPRLIRIGMLVKFRPEDLAAYVEANAHGGAAA